MCHELGMINFPLFTVALIIHRAATPLPVQTISSSRIYKRLRPRPFGPRQRKPPINKPHASITGGYAGYRQMSSKPYANVIIHRRGPIADFTLPTEKMWAISAPRHLPKTEKC
jgi:hypothetical protein